ncbi:MAG TPA: hypothetical protein DCY35_12155 [Prolixibacteraceae bacterium]|nr:hypothetical protein [Prolixibacteraceae bacterium]
MLNSSNSYEILKPEVQIDQVSLITEGIVMRRELHKNRNSRGNIEKLATKLFVMIDLEKPELSRVKLCMDSGNFTQALKAYREFVLQKMKYTGDIYWENTYSYVYTPMIKINDIEKGANELLFNIFTTTDGKYVSLGEPGVINWKFDLPVKKFERSYFFAKNVLWNLSTFDPLLRSFIATNNIIYLKKWCEYTDDWCLNQDSFSRLLPPELPDAHASASGLSDFLYHLKRLGQVLPQNGEGLSEATLARVLIKLLKEYLPMEVTYLRSNPQNWTTNTFTLIFATGLLLEELGFKDAKFYIRAGLRRAEDYATTHKLPDGTDIEQNLPYDAAYARWGIASSYKLLKTLKPSLVDQDWYDEQYSHMVQRVNFLIRMLSPEGKFPSGCRIDLRGWIDGIKGFLLMKEQFISEQYMQKENASIVSAVQGNTENGMPSFASDWYPYGGYYNFREGWLPGSHYGFMFSSTHPGGYEFRTLSGNNVFVLNAFSQDLLVAGEVGNYDIVKSPLLVDGKQQYYNAGIPQWGHRHTMVSAWDEPAKSRWHTSTYFDFGEALYHGCYGEGIPEQGYASIYGDKIRDLSLESQKKASTSVIRGIAHRRLVYYIREHGLWIVIDRMSSEEYHRYTQQWRLPVKPVGSRFGNYKAFTSENIQINAATNSIKTQDNGMANISVYNFSTKPISYGYKIEEIPLTNGGKISDFYCAESTIEGQGEQIIISVIYPRKTQADDILNIQAIRTESDTSTVGFIAVLPEGAKVGYLAAADKNQYLKVEDIEVKGESLLVVKNTAGARKGIAMGCGSISVCGRIHSIEFRDFEFSIEDDRMKEITPIYTPLEPVKVLPETNVFSEQLEITMATSTEGVDVRYTTDGSDPVPASRLYIEPFTIKDTALIKARAFRKGITEVPETMSGTHATVVTRAVFTKQDMRESQDGGVYANGLKYEYYEGNWKETFVSFDNCTPVKTGVVEKLFDTSPRQTKGPYSFRYSGLIEAAVDGLYTFHAPREYMRPDIMEGYELNVYLDDEQWYPATRRHAFGTWSIPLKKGKHKFIVTYTDYRANTAAEYNMPGLNNLIWEGEVPALMISGPDLEKQYITENMLYRNID